MSEMSKSSYEQRERAADAIADLADAGEDISRFFSRNGRMVRPQGKELPGDAVVTSKSPSQKAA